MATTDPTLITGSTRSATDIATVAGVEGRTPWQLFWMRFKKDKAALLGIAFVVILVLVALGAPLYAHFVAHHGPNDLFDNMVNDFGLPRGPNRAFLLGADSVGRDVLVRIMYGARTSLAVSVISTSIAVAIGVTLGMMAGYLGGWIDALISRTVDIILSMPLLIFAIGISAACSVNAQGCLGGLIKPGVPLVIFNISFFTWAYMARIVRGQTFSLREREFIEASRSLGASSTRIMFREVLPNLVAPIVIYSTLLIPSNILFESYLSFLGLGVGHKVPSWGAMVSGATDVYQVAWWLMVFPGLMLLFTTLAFNLVGDGLRDALDPRSSRA